MAGEVELKGYLYNTSGVAVSGATVSAYDRDTTTPAIDTTTTDANGMWRFDAAGANALTAPADIGYDIEVVSGSLKLRSKFNDKIAVYRAEAIELSLRDSGDGTHRILLSAPTVTGDRAVYFPDADGPVLVRNEGAVDLDQRIEGIADANLIYVDAGNDRVGIGTATPAGKFEVSAAAVLAYLTVTSAGSPSLLLRGVRSTSTQTDIGRIRSTWDGNEVAEIRFRSGVDSSNKDDGQIAFLTSPSASTPAVRALIDQDGKVFIGDTANANADGASLTINQGADDSEAITLKSSDIAHGVTSFTETDTYAYLLKYDATAGGFLVTGLSEQTVGIALSGVGTTVDTTKTTAAVGAAYIDTWLKSGTGGVVLSADGNLLAIASAGTARFIFDVEGSGHADVEWTTYDVYDDLALIDSMETELLLREDEAQTERRHMLEAAGIIGRGSWHMERGRPKAMVNFTKLAMLHHGALRQVAERLRAIESQLAALPAGG